MSLWIELHCDTSPDVRNARASGEEEVVLGPRCWSDSGRQTGISIRNRGLTEGIQRLRISAIEAGWKRIRGVGWCCPHCAKVLQDRGRVR